MPRAATSWRVSNSSAWFCKRTRREQSDNADPGAPESSRTAPPAKHQSTDRRRPVAFGQNSACKSLTHFSDAAPTHGHRAQMLTRTNPRYVISRQDYGIALDELRNLVRPVCAYGICRPSRPRLSQSYWPVDSLTCSADLRRSRQRHWPVNLLPGAIGQANPSSCSCLTAEVCCRSMSPIAPPTCGSELVGGQATRKSPARRSQICSHAELCAAIFVVQHGDLSAIGVLQENVRHAAKARIGRCLSNCRIFVAAAGHLCCRCRRVGHGGYPRVDRRAGTIPRMSLLVSGVPGALGWWLALPALPGPARLLTLPVTLRRAWLEAVPLGVRVRARVSVPGSA